MNELWIDINKEPIKEDGKYLIFVPNGKNTIKNTVIVSAVIDGRLRGLHQYPFLESDITHYIKIDFPEVF